MKNNRIFISGVCPVGSFACDKGKTCVLQRQYCDGKDHCRDRQDENITECGHFHGSKEMLNNLWMRSHSKSKIVKPKCGLLIWMVSAEFILICLFYIRFSCWWAS